MIPPESVGHEQSSDVTPEVEESHVMQSNPSAEGIDPFGQRTHCTPLQ